MTGLIERKQHRGDATCKGQGLPADPEDEAERKFAQCWPLDSTNDGPGSTASESHGRSPAERGKGNVDHLPISRAVVFEGRKEGKKVESWLHLSDRNFRRRIESAKDRKTNINQKEKEKRKEKKAWKRAERNISASRSKGKTVRIVRRFALG